MYEVASGLAYIHSKDICHRDMKPSNIIIKEPGIPSSKISNLVITDFGISSKHPKIVRGGALHAAPEIALAKRKTMISY